MSAEHTNLTDAQVEAVDSPVDPSPSVANDRPCAGKAPDIPVAPPRDNGDVTGCEAPASDTPSTGTPAVTDTGSTTTSTTTAVEHAAASLTNGDREAQVEASVETAEGHVGSGEASVESAHSTLSDSQNPRGDSAGAAADAVASDAATAPAPASAGSATPPANVRTWSPQTPPLHPEDGAAKRREAESLAGGGGEDGGKEVVGEGSDTDSSDSSNSSSSSSSSGSSGFDDAPATVRIAAVTRPTRGSLGRYPPEDLSSASTGGEGVWGADELAEIQARAILVRPPSQPVAEKHVDPAEVILGQGRGEAAGREGGGSAAEVPTPSAGSSAALVAVDEGHDRRATPSPLPGDVTGIWSDRRVFGLIAQYCDCRSLCQLMRVSRQMHVSATHDSLWHHLVTNSLNLQPLVADLRVTKDYYRFFIDEIITTRALHGHYTYVALSHAPPHSGSSSYGSHSAQGGINGDIFSIEGVTLRISPARFGQMNHDIGRVQLLIRYKTQSMEVLQGSCRFSPYRRCFSFSCNAFSSLVRGPVFTVAVAQVHRPWSNESPQHFVRHQGGVRLIMTPALLEGTSKAAGSLLTEADVIAVSRAPRPKPYTKTNRSIGSLSLGVLASASASRRGSAASPKST